MSENVKDIMEEPVGGDNHGRAASTDPNEEGRHVPLDVKSMQVAEFMRQGAGFVALHGAHGGGPDTGGLVAHRGTLYPGEYVDFFALREEVEVELGFAYADVSAAYAQGRPTAEQRQLREKIDARLLALSRAGGNMEQLAKVLDISEKTVDRALRRARIADVAPMVKDAAVVRDRVCFKTGELGAKPRRRRFSTSPSQWVGTVDLTDEEYAKGFERQPGDPAYWEFRLHSKITPEGPRPRKREQRFPSDWPSEQSYQDFVASA